MRRRSPRPPWTGSRGATRRNLRSPHEPGRLLQLAPAIRLDAYLGATGAPPFDELNNANPAFFGASTGSSSDADRRVEDVPRVAVIRLAGAPRLSPPFVEEDFRFNGQYNMRGAKAREARWKTCVRQVDRDLGEASGRLFVERYFGPEGKQKMREIVTNVMAALEGQHPAGRRRAGRRSASAAGGRSSGRTAGPAAARPAAADRG